MKTGDTVKVYPHGSPDQAAVGRVAILASNGLSLGIIFDDKPPFAISKAGAFIDPGNGAVVMLAIRHTLGGQPWGPWVEMVGGGHYEVETYSQSEK